jgi:fructuronate reductase/mannitol 2-dehydrogenase
LNTTNLPQTARDVATPSYARDALVPGVVHIGVGGFHRAHQELYFDELAQRGVTDWGVIGVGLHSRAMKDALEPQELLYTVVERDADADEARVVGSLIRYLYAPEDPGAVLEALTDEQIRLVTLTVTGSGYDLELQADAIRADQDHPERPSTFAGFLVEALDRRRRAGTAPFTVLSCDNVPSNGEAARDALLEYARGRDPQLAGWIESEVAFPSSMVDRITPETTDETAQLVQRQFGLEDRSPVVTEPFRQWIVEDHFGNQRPPLDAVGVQFVPDVAPYELMKKRLLNGSHCALGYLGVLAGHGTTADALADPVFREYVQRLMGEEVAPLLDAVPGIDLDEYQRTLLERFANPKINDALQRLCRRGSTKMPSYILPSIREAMEAGRPHTLLTLAVAGWLRYLRGVGFGGEEIPIQDARKDQLQPLAREGGEDPRPLLAERSVFGDLMDRPAFVSALEDALRGLERDGARETIDIYLTARDMEVAA